MCNKVILLIVLLFSILHISISPAFTKEPENLHTLKQQVVFYHDSGECDFDQETVTQRARNYLEKRISNNNRLQNKERLAIVFDIDETTLSNYEHLFELNFGIIPQLVLEEIQKADDPAIKATQRLYQYARKQGIAVFFITGRAEKLRVITKKNLKSVGYDKWDGLYMKPNDYENKSVIPYKSSMRKIIQDMGYTIVVNIGDQFSDLAGGYAESVYKLPNPYYFIP